MFHATALDAALAAAPSHRLSERHRARVIAALSGCALTAGLALSLAGCGKPRSADAANETPKPPPIRDEAWAIAARAAHNAELVGTRFGRPSPGSPSTRGWPIQWPFAGFAP
ncbi:MAG: hypothetical protein ACKO3W_05580, partial [bacterium]